MATDKYVTEAALSSLSGLLFEGDDGYPDRPSDSPVIFIGPTDPAGLAQNRDAWIETDA